MARVRTSSLLLAVATVAALVPALLPSSGASADGAAAHRDRAVDHLLAAERLPVVGERTWTLVADGPEAGTTVGRCQKAPLTTLGALTAAHRGFVAPDGFTAEEVVGEFVDARSAWRVQQVLLAWREDCAARLADAEVGELQPVAVPTGSGAGYRGAFGTDPHTAGLAILRAGRHLVLVEVSSPTERYPDRWDPARVAVRRIARTF